MGVCSSSPNTVSAPIANSDESKPNDEEKGYDDDDSRRGSTASSTDASFEVPEPPKLKHRREGSIEVGDPTANLPAGARAGVAGLRNLGNTCFMNAAIQALSHTIPLTDYFVGASGFDFHDELNEDNPLGMGGELARAYQALIHRLWHGKDKAFAPKSFKSSISKYAPQFSGYEQHDLQELIAFLLDGLHEDLNRVLKKPYVEDIECDGRSEELVAVESWKNYLLRNKSVIVDLFQGQLRSTLTCCSCQYTRVKFDPFMYLSLPVPEEKSGRGGTRSRRDDGVALDECLEAFTAQERLEGDEQWYCPKCKDHVDALKKIDLWKTPAVLIVHLKRFRWTDDGYCEKISRGVRFPMTGWNLKNRMSSPQRDAPVYDLYAVASHHGGFGSGHYTATARNVQADSSWHEFNDSSVKKCDEDNVKRATAECYVLFYHQMVVSEKHQYRRQSISLPQLWPHMTGASGGNSFVISPKEAKEGKAEGKEGKGDATPCDGFVEAIEL